jgi:serine/threonine-protein kinase
MSEPLDPEIGVGTVIADTYVVTHLLGRGGMGAVWAADHRRLPGKRVAIKVLLNWSQDAESLARFRREAEIASRLGHPNIVEVLDFHTLPSGTPYMVLELLEGESLAGRLRRGALSPEETMALVRQVGSALAAAHREGVVHRDLKPDNIFLCPTDSDGVVTTRVKVLDFGISKIRGSSTVQTQESALLGTPQYMSPEQAFGRNASIDQRSDVFALSAIVYECLTGRPVFGGSSIAEVVLKIVHEEAPRLQGVPERVARGVAQGLSKEADARQPDVATFVEQLTGTALQTLERRSSVRAAQVASRTIDPLAATGAGAAGGAVTGAGTPSSGASGWPSVNGLPTATREAIGLPSPKGRQRLYAFAGVVLIGVGAGAFVLLSHGGGPRRGSEPGTLESASEPTGSGTTRPTGASGVAVPAATGASGVAVLGVTGASGVVVPAATGASGVTVPGVTGASGVVVPAATGASGSVVGAVPGGETAGPGVPLGQEARPTRPAVEPKARRPVESLPPALAAELDQVERLLDSRSAEEALRIARRTLRTQVSSRAFGLMTRAYCQLGDLGNAKAQLRNVAAADRSAIVRRCARDGLELE